MCHITVWLQYVNSAIFLVQSTEILVTAVDFINQVSEFLHVQTHNEGPYLYKLNFETAQQVQL